MFQNQSIPRVSRPLMLKCHLLWEAFGDLPLPQAHELLPLLPLALASVLLLRSGVCAYTPLSLNCELLEQSRAGLDRFRLLQVCGIQRKGSQGEGVGSGLEGGAFVKLRLVSQGHMD